MAKISGIKTDLLLRNAQRLVSPITSKYGDKPISAMKFKKLMEHADVEHIEKVRFQKTVTTHQAKKFLGSFLKHIQEHPQYKVSGFAKEMVHAKLHQGDHAIQNFDPKMLGEHGLEYLREEQAKETQTTGPSLEEKQRLERRQAAIKNLNIRHSAEERDKLTSVVPKDVVGSANAAKAQSSVFGDTKTAGTVNPGSTKAVPGNTTTGAPRPVQLGGGMASQLGHQQQEKATVVPVFGVTQAKASADPGKPVAEDNFQALVQAEAAAKAGNVKAEDDLPNTDDVDTNLPLAA
ncbi:MAG: hypothetical protein WCV85_05455 [Patescibacteria group bacterium]